MSMILKTGESEAKIICIYERDTKEELKYHLIACFSEAILSKDTIENCIYGIASSLPSSRHKDMHIVKFPASFSQNIGVVIPEWQLLVSQAADQQKDSDHGD